MSYLKIKFVLTFLNCLLLTWFFSCATAVDLEEEDGNTTYSYNLGDSNGPMDWGNLNSQWKVCGTGKSQSPIPINDFQVELVSALPTIHNTYRNAPASIKRTVHELQVEWQGNVGGIVLNGSEYKLIQCHWHTPAEHVVDGIRYAAELHVFHQSSRGDVAVTAIFYALAWFPDPFLNWLIPHLSLSSSDLGKPLGLVNPLWIGLDDKAYYRYIGSRTSPPCSENVTWTLFKMVRPIAAWQVGALRASIKDGYVGNARPLQEMDGRTVQGTGPTFDV